MGCHRDMVGGCSRDMRVAAVDMGVPPGHGGCSQDMGMQPGNGGTAGTHGGCSRGMGCSQDMRGNSQGMGCSWDMRGAAGEWGVQLGHGWGCSRGTGRGVQPGNGRRGSSAGRDPEHTPLLALPGSTTLSLCLPAKAGTLSCSKSQQALRSLSAAWFSRLLSPKPHPTSIPKHTYSLRSTQAPRTGQGQHSHRPSKPFWASQCLHSRICF